MGSSRVAISADFLPPVWVLHPRVPPLLHFPWMRREGRVAGFLPECLERFGGVLCFPAAALREAECSGRSGAFAGTRAHSGSPWQGGGGVSCPSLQCGWVRCAQTETGSFYKLPFLAQC